MTQKSVSSVLSVRAIRFFCSFVRVFQRAFPQVVEKFLFYLVEIVVKTEILWKNRGYTKRISRVISQSAMERRIPPVSVSTSPGTGRYMGERPVITA